MPLFTSCFHSLFAGRSRSFRVFTFLAIVLSPVRLSGADRPGAFETKIAPLLSKHCLECHSDSKKKGRLDLSRKDPAFAGGKNGTPIIPGKASDSLLWTRVESNEMPDDRPPLSADEKKILREWIEQGADWPSDVVLTAPEPPEIPTGRTWVRRLTVPEYTATIRAAVDVDVATEARNILPPDVRTDGFHNTAYNLNIDLAHVEAYSRLATLTVSRMDVLKFAKRFGDCAELSNECISPLIAKMGKWLLRGPVAENELRAFVKLSTAVDKQGGNFKEAVASIIEAMLQSPRFIYRMEKEPAPGQSRDPYELASRLSYILWGAPPDAALLRAADSGKLEEPSEYHGQIQRMLNDPRAVERSTRFAYEWLNLEGLRNLRPNAKRFPKWNSALAGDMQRETTAFFEHLAWQEKRPLWDLLNARVTFITPRLAAHYRIDSKFTPDLASLPPESDKSLLALYTFQERKGGTVRDLSGRKERLNLKIDDTAAVEWKDGALRVLKPTLISSANAPKRLISALKKSDAITIEAWITPASAEQSGPARIVTLSAGPSQRNFTLGHDGNRFEVRLRATGADANGMPSLRSATRTATTKLTHVAYTRDAAGRGNIYVNGEQKGAYDVGGDFSNWDSDFRLALANETSNDRPWLGTFHRVAIFSRALTAPEIAERAHPISRYDLAKVSSRGGLLTQGGILTVGGDEASMVTRGLFLLKNFLWGSVEDPPPCVDTTPVPTKPGLTQRAIAESRLSNAACAGCHTKFEPFAFGLEKFDGVGAFHENDEHGNTLRDDGEIIFPETEKPFAYKNSAELMDLLAESDRVRKGITRKLTQFAIGRPLVSADAPVIDQIHSQAVEKGGTYHATITAILMSELVRDSEPTTEREP